MTQDLRIFELLASQAERAPKATAILAPGRAPLTYERLYVHVRNTAKTLNTLGVGRGDRVALVLPSERNEDRHWPTLLSLNSAPQNSSFVRPKASSTMCSGTRA
jgi:acyl-CoA synthetase (AMP-forming)/AMP-acid ligase II